MATEWQACWSPHSIHYDSLLPYSTYPHGFVLILYFRVFWKSSTDTALDQDWKYAHLCLEALICTHNHKNRGILPVLVYLYSILLYLNQNKAKLYWSTHSKEWDTVLGGGQSESAVGILCTTLHR